MSLSSPIPTFCKFYCFELSMGCRAWTGTRMGAWMWGNSELPWIRSGFMKHRVQGWTLPIQECRNAHTPLVAPPFAGLLF